MERTHCRNYSQETKGAEQLLKEQRIKCPLLECYIQSSSKRQFQQIKWESSDRKLTVKSDLRRTMSQQKKLADERANGMDVGNAAIKQLSYKVKEQEIITAHAKAAGDEAATWAANVLNKN